LDNNTICNAAEIQKASAQLAAVRPAYASIVNFYSAVFAAQAAAQTNPAPIPVDEADLKMRLEEGFSLITPARFAVDQQAAAMLLTQICQIASSSGENLADAGQALAQAIAEGMLPDDLFTDILEQRGRIRDLGAALDIDGKMLSLLAYLAIQPSIEAGARELAPHLADNHFDRGNCPICGSAPIIGELDETGKQWLHCGWCWHRWSAKRLACPHCGNRDHASLEYIYSDEEPEYRVSLCGQCGQYLKVVDVRKMTRLFYPPLEQMATLHLDMLAAERETPPDDTSQ
jgi:FdhE protein